jgi:hypothetical protein
VRDWKKDPPDNTLEAAAMCFAATRARIAPLLIVGGIALLILIGWLWGELTCAPHCGMDWLNP